MTIHVQPTADLQVHLDPNGILLAAILLEVGTTATDEQERSFLLATGQRIAAAFPLTGLVELGALEEAMNHAWRMLDLGNVYLFTDQNGIGIEHRRSAQRCAVAEGQWDSAEPVILEGVYGRWFATIGSDRLSLKCLGRSYDKVSFHYGR